MPTRLLREGILTSERVNKLSLSSEVLYRRIMSVVDDYGRYFANPQLLRAACFPLRLEAMKDDAIRKGLSEIEAAGLLILYSISGNDYLELRDFNQQIRAKKSKFPAIPENANVHHLRSGGVANA